ncbi:MAG: hypothetical protein GX786_10760, partial [Clostridiales bacterium]|nr:hypothetical protein [Clostridiales bacterium]
MKEPFCPIIQDLLPNYIEGLCSEETVSVIKEHLSQCENCKNKLTIMEEALSSPSPVSTPKNPLKKIKRHYLTRFLVVFLVIALLAPPTLWLVNGFRGEGMSFASFTANSHVQSLLRSLEQGNFPIAAEQMVFDKQGTLDTNLLGPTTKEAFIDRMTALEQKGVKIISGHSKLFDFQYSQGHMMGKTNLTVEVKGDHYLVTFPLLYSEGKIAFYQPLVAFGPQNTAGNYPQINWNASPPWFSQLKEA